MTTKIEDSKQLARYWATILERRMPVEDEVAILARVLCGFYLSHIMSASDQWERMGVVLQASKKEILQFHSSKRPYGNKDVEASIAYNLGWDCERQLCYHAMPEVIREECRKLHALVLEELKENMDVYIGE